MTYRQASEIGAQVRKGQTGATVVYASRFTKTETDTKGEEVARDIPFLKTYTVFNCEQIDGLPDHYYHWPDKVIDPVAVTDGERCRRTVPTPARLAPLRSIAVAAECRST